MYKDEILNGEFNTHVLEEHFGFLCESNDDFTLITVSLGNSFMLYKKLDLMVIDYKGERYELAKPKLIGDFIRDCQRLEVI